MNLKLTYFFFFLVMIALGYIVLDRVYLYPKKVEKVHASVIEQYTEITDKKGAKVISDDNLETFELQAGNEKYDVRVNKGKTIEVIILGKDIIYDSKTK